LNLEIKADSISFHQQVQELFPAEVCYTSSSLTFNFAVILDASLAPYVATWLATHYSLPMSATT